MQPPSPKDSRDVEQQQAWFDGLPEEARKAALRAELDKNLPVLASIMREVGVAGLCAWAAYLDVMESGNVDPFDMGEIIGAAVPTIKRSIEKDSAERLEEVERQRELAVENGAVLLRKAEAALAGRDRQVEEVVEDFEKLAAQAEGAAQSGLPNHIAAKQGAWGAYQDAAEILRALLAQPSSNPPQQDRFDVERGPLGPRAVPAQQDREEGEDEHNPEHNLPEWLGIYADRLGRGEAITDDERLLFQLTLRAAKQALEPLPQFTGSSVLSGFPKEGEIAPPLTQRIVDETQDKLLTQPEADPEVPRCGLKKLVEEFTARAAEDNLTGAQKAVWAHAARRLEETLAGDCQSPPRATGEGEMNYCKWCNHEIGHEEGCPEAPAARQRDEEFDAAQVVWVCEKGHVDDHHLSIPGVEERCSRCGGKCEGFKSLDFLARALIDARSTQPVSESPGDSGVGLWRALADPESVEQIARYMATDQADFDARRPDLLEAAQNVCEQLPTYLEARAEESGIAPDATTTLSPQVAQHLREIVSGMVDGFDPRCIVCASILRSLAVRPADAVTLTQPVPGNSGGVEEGLLEAIRRDLHSESEETTGLAGPLGAAIADASGSSSLEFTTPEQVAEGICTWLEAWYE